MREVEQTDKQMDVKTSVEAECRRKTWEHLSTTGQRVKTIETHSKLEEE